MHVGRKSSEKSFFITIVIVLQPFSRLRAITYKTASDIRLRTDFEQHDKYSNVIILRNKSSSVYTLEKQCCEPYGADGRDQIFTSRTNELPAPPSNLCY